MGAGKLMWTGVACWLCALLISLFPSLAFDLGMDRSGGWQVFGFGLFLIVLSAALGVRSGRG